MDLQEIESMECPQCGYYCSGSGGMFCIDKKGLYEKASLVDNKG